ncbi:unnamed protein product [Prunus armeniaca]|uniref:Uncharacterized protein n=1 Tax=Prunus armeniaca TaxID=36596 RepID=A0A6J5X987_PRUAR|nr:unnamed protein product [Prunus armeniaca]
MDPIDRPQRIGNLEVMLGLTWIQLSAPKSMDPNDCSQEIGNSRGDIGIDMDPIDYFKRIGNLGGMLEFAWIQLIALKGMVTPGKCKVWY